MSEKEATGDAVESRLCESTSFFIRGLFVTCLNLRFRGKICSCSATTAIILNKFHKEREVTIPSTSTGSRGSRGKTAQYYREYSARKRTEMEKEVTSNMSTSSEPSTNVDSCRSSVSKVKPFAK